VNNSTQDRIEDIIRREGIQEDWKTERQEGKIHEYSGEQDRRTGGQEDRKTGGLKDRKTGRQE
jgi:hypothetical protein